MVSERYISDAKTHNDMILMLMVRMDLWMEPVHFYIHTYTAQYNSLQWE